MAIYCSQCGKDHPDDANFCMKCGAPLREGFQTSQPEPQWEYCEIVFAELRAGGITRREKIQFWAKAIGPQGEYNAGMGPEASADQPGWGRITSSVGQDQTDYRPALNALIAQLSGEGWEPVPNKGYHWFNYQFRRRVG